MITVGILVSYIVAVLGWVMFRFAILCVVAIGFVYRFLPETKGLSVEGAVQVFEREAAESGTTPRNWFKRPAGTKA